MALTTYPAVVDGYLTTLLLDDADAERRKPQIEAARVLLAGHDDATVAPAVPDATVPDVGGVVIFDAAATVPPETPPAPPALEPVSEPAAPTAAEAVADEQPELDLVAAEKAAPRPANKARTSPSKKE